MQFDSPRHHEILWRMHSGSGVHPLHQRVSDLKLVALASTVSSVCPHAMSYATATRGIEFLRELGHELRNSSGGEFAFEDRVVSAACIVGASSSAALGAIFQFDVWRASFTGPSLLLGRHEARAKPLEVFGYREFDFDVLSFVRFVHRFLAPGTPLELLRHDSPRRRKQRIEATRTQRGVEFAEVTA